MRLLTGEERDVLAFLTTQGMRPPRKLTHGTDLHALHVDLQMQGRALHTPYEPGPASSGRWTITAAGREALRLWPLLVERGLVQP